MIDEKDLAHVLRMVLNENRGNVLTEALGLGIEQAVFFYISRVASKPLEDSSVGETDGL